MALLLSLTQAITDKAVRRLAGDRYYQRGLDYFRNGHVSTLEVWGTTIHAEVSGTEDYAVELTADGKNLDYDCDCPLGCEGEFCKHCVAAALAWLDTQRETDADERASDRVSKASKAESKAAAKAVTVEDAARVLQSEDKEALVALILEWADHNEELRGKLLQRAARALGPNAAIRETARALEKAIRAPRYVSYREAGAYAGAVDSAIDSVEMLLQSGQAEAVIELCEKALQWLAAAIGNVDDSDGQGTELSGRLQHIHLRACEEARPDPVELARRLFRLELESEYGEFGNSSETYAAVLGAQGLLTFRELAQIVWERVPARTPSETPLKEIDYYSITSIMVSLARQSGDVEQLVSVLERDLSNAYRYLRIAEAYRDAGNADKSLAWAEDGLAAFPANPDTRLRLFLAEEYQRRDRHQDALRLLWLEFRARPALDTYKLLEEFARRDDDWDEWRKRALQHIRGALAERPKSISPAASGSSSAAVLVSRWRDRKKDRSLLVEIFLYERDAQEAWREASGGGCSDTLWLLLAEEREKTHPDEAVPVYMRLAESNIANAHGHRYDDAVDLLQKAAQSMCSQGRSQEFHRQIESLRLKYKAKRNFQKLVEERRTTLYLA